MTVTVTAPPSAPPSGASGSGWPAQGQPRPVGARTVNLPGRADLRRVTVLVALGVVVLVAAEAVVLYAVGPLVHDRDQRRLMAAERGAIAHAAGKKDGIYGPTLPTQPPAPGAPVGMLVIPALGLQQAVVEGVTGSQTVAGPGHVPGTAGLGQPGNAAVVARRAGYGGPFSELARLERGDRVVTATTEGETVYLVRSVRVVSLETSGPSSSHHSTTGLTTVTSPTTRRRSASKASSPRSVPAKETMTALYGPSSHNQLTLVTSASAVPWNTDRAVVVVARMKGLPYTPTPQEARSSIEWGTTGGSGALPWLLLALLAFLGAVVGAVALYRHATVRAAYLLTSATLLALIVLVAEAASHMLPAWL